MLLTLSISETDVRGEIALIYRGYPMVEECTINVGFHSHFGTFRLSERSKTPLRLAFIDRIPFNSTYECPKRGKMPRLRSLV